MYGGPTHGSGPGQPSDGQYSQQQSSAYYPPPPPSHGYLSYGQYQPAPPPPTHFPPPQPDVTFAAMYPSQQYYPPSSAPPPSPPQQPQQQEEYDPLAATSSQANEGGPPGAYDPLGAPPPPPPPPPSNTPAPTNIYADAQGSFIERFAQMKEEKEREDKSLQEAERQVKALKEAHARRVAAENQSQRKRKGGRSGGVMMKRRGGAGTVASVFSMEDDEDEEGDEEGKKGQLEAGEEGGPQPPKRSRWASEGEKDVEHGEERMTEEMEAKIRALAAWKVKNPERGSQLEEERRGQPGWEFLGAREDRKEGGKEGGKKWELARRFYEEVLEEVRVKEQVRLVASGEDEGGGRGGGSEAATVLELSRLSLPPSALHRAASSVVGPLSSHLPPPALASLASDASTAAVAKKPKRNRWGPESGVPPSAPPSAPPSLPPSLPPSTRKKDGKKNALDEYLPTVMDAAAMTQLQEQKRIQALEKKIREAARLKALAEGGKEGGKEVELFQERALYYEELAEKEGKGQSEGEAIRAIEAENRRAAGGVEDGGTWEHRKRAKEMLQTAEDALHVTLASKGRHHVAQYLPAGEMERLLQSAGKGGAGKGGDEGDFAANRLEAETNVGMQLLKKQGWNEGQGLGAEGKTGVKAPVNMQTTGGEGVGVGGGGEEEAGEEGGDDFENYRRRMMLAYRFRPNPLNNPRRAYY